MVHFDKVPVQPATLHAHWGSIDACVSRGNPAGAAFQLFKVTQSAPRVTSDSSAASWVLNGGGEISPSAAEFPQVLFAKWCWLLQQVGEKLPYQEENWQTVLGALTESCQQLTASGLECGIASTLAQQLVTAQLSACTTGQAQESADHLLPQQQADTPVSDPCEQQPSQAAAPRSAGGRTPSTRVALAPLTVAAQGGEALASAAAAGCGSAVVGQENVAQPHQQQAAAKKASAASGKKAALQVQAPLSSKRTRLSQL